MKGAPLTKPRAFLSWFFFHSSSEVPKPYLQFNSQRSFKQKNKPKNIKFCQASFIEQSKLRTPLVVTPSCNKNPVQKHRKSKPPCKIQNLVLKQKFNLIMTLTHTGPNFWWLKKTHLQEIRFQGQNTKQHKHKIRVQRNLHKHNKNLHYALEW